MQCAVGIEIDVVAHLHIRHCTRRHAKTGYFHIALLVEVHRHLHLHKSFLGVDDALVLAVEHKLLYEAGTAHVDATRIIVIAGCETADDADCADNAIYRFHNCQFSIVSFLSFITTVRSSEYSVRWMQPSAPWVSADTRSCWL